MTGKITEILSSIFGGDKIVDSLVNAVDTFVTTGAEKAEIKKQFQELIHNQEMEAARLINEEMANARNREIEVAKTDAGWLAKNIVSLLAIAWTAFTFILLILVLIGSLVATDNMAFLVVNGVFNVVMLIIGYYFGSSTGSKKKDDFFDIKKAKEIAAK